MAAPVTERPFLYNNYWKWIASSLTFLAMTSFLRLLVKTRHCEPKAKQSTMKNVTFYFQNSYIYMVTIMKKLTKTLLCAACTISFISCASKSQDTYDYSYDDSYDYTLDESEITFEEEAESNENFLADIAPVDLEPLYFLRKSKKTMKPLEVRKVALVPRTNAVEFHFRETANDIAVIWRKAERDKILEACQNFLDKYENKTLEHFKVSSKTAYFKSKCSLWYGPTSST